MTLTKAQRKAVYDIWKRPVWGEPNELTYREFRAGVIPCLGYVMVQWADMWLGIEPDGYTHS